jgi:short-subunit dehydrogenase
VAPRYDRARQRSRHQRGVDGGLPACACADDLCGNTGVTITALCPGPVATEFTEAGGFKHEKPGPSFVWSSAEEVAKAGIEGAEKGKRVVVPGMFNRFQTSLGRHGPRSLLLGPAAAAYRRTIGE